MAFARAEIRKINRVAEWLAQVSQELCESGEGGYPDAVEVVAGYVVVATAIEDEPQLQIYDPQSVLKWHDDVVAYRRDNRRCPLWEAVGESRPEEAGACWEG